MKICFNCLAKISKHILQNVDSSLLSQNITLAVPYLFNFNNVLYDPIVYPIKGLVMKYSVSIVIHDYAKRIKDSFDR